MEVKMDLSPPIIQIRNLQQSYDGKTVVLNGIDLDIQPGRIIGYIGPNGAGKTTTVKIMTGMLADFQGSVSVFGLDIRKEALEIKRRIGYVPENTALYDTLTPREYLEFICRLYDVPEDDILIRIEKMLNVFGLASEAGKRMTSFSKGMKQKILLISGMIHNPDVIFLDEPLSGLDANTAILFKEIITKLAAEGKTIFYCSHIMDVVERISHRIVVIDKGAIVADGTFEELQSMSKGASLEKIFAQLTGSRGHDRLADEFISASRRQT
jgi:ABC-2 type transport system ATP-binding protein